MERNKRLEEIFKLLKELPEEELSALVNDVYKKLASGGNGPGVCSAFAGETVSACKSCGSVNFVKNGKDRNGSTRYMCRDCGKTFGALTNTVVSGTHKSASVWKQYVAAMLGGGTLEECAQRCNISIPTAFVWRHKILNALSQESFNRVFRGLVEMDEMYVRISYKGNHSKSKGFTMPRAPYKRGSDNRIPGNNSKVSVLCVVERDKSFSGVVPCTGTINSPLLSQVFKEHLSDESVVLTDGLRAYNQFFCTTNVEHIVLPSQNGGKPCITGPYHINNVNALHRRFRRFLEKYNGVSTKYLSNYLALFLWVENHRGQDKPATVCDALLRAGTYATAKQLRQIAPIPDFAPAA